MATAAVGKSFPWTTVSMTGNTCLGIATESSESCTSIYKKSLLTVFSHFLLYFALIFFLLSHLSSDTLDNGHCVLFYSINVTPPLPPRLTRPQDTPVISVTRAP